jgi:hypothetical protein
MTQKEAARFTLENVFPNWKPGKITNTLEKQADKHKQAYL